MSTWEDMKFTSKPDIASGWSSGKAFRILLYIAGGLYIILQAIGMFNGV